MNMIWVLPMNETIILVSSFDFDSRTILHNEQSTQIALKSARTRKF